MYRRVCGCARAGPRVQACAHVCACVSEAGACGAGVWGAGPGFPPDKHPCHRSTPGSGGGESDAAGRAQWYASQVRRVPFSLC